MDEKGAQKFNRCAMEIYYGNFIYLWKIKENYLTWENDDGGYAKLHA